MEKLELSNNNEKLMKENKDCNTVSECRAKILDLHNEKASLPTAMKLIQRDSKEELEIYKKTIEILENESKNLREEIYGFNKYKTPTTTDPLQTNILKNQFEA